MNTTTLKFAMVAVSALAFATTIGACDDEGDPPVTDTATDAAAETSDTGGTDTAPNDTIGGDLPDDATVDTGTDTVPDIGPDTSQDVGTGDAVADSGTNDVVLDGGGDAPGDTPIGDATVGDGGSETSVGDAIAGDSGGDVLQDGTGTDASSDSAVDGAVDVGPDTSDVPIDTTPPIELPPDPWTECLAHCAALDTLTCSYVEVTKAGCDSACAALAQPDYAGQPNAVCIPKVQALLTCIATNNPGYECDEELGAPGVGQACGNEFWSSLACFRRADSCNSQCDAIVAASCAAGPVDKGKCMRWCHPASTQNCSGAADGLGACIGFPGTPTYTCDGNGAPVEDGCETYSNAFATCAGPQLP